MKLIKLLLLFAIVIGSEPIVRAQCVDPNRYNPGYPCNIPTYSPVCGCDGKTYRTDCEAYYKFGVLSWVAGTCTGFEIDLLPNFFGQNDPPPIFSFAQSAQITAEFVILDIYGKIFVQKTLPAVYNYTFDLNEASNLPQGTYLVLVYNARGAYRYKKIIKL